MDKGSIRYRRSTCRDRFTDELRDDLLNAYKQVISNIGEDARFITKQELYKRTVESPAPRFYIGHEHAARLIRESLKKK
jgi:hypothetical protein